MARRPVFCPDVNPGSLVREILVEFEWHAGFSISQKRKSISALHRASEQLGINPILEISTKSDAELGRKLSAFNLSLFTRGKQQITVEAAFQGGKVFAGGGPFRDFYTMSGRDIKSDPRLRNSGRLIGFDFDGVSWPIEPKTAFYDWLYVTALCQNKKLSDPLLSFKGFTDIEFNQRKSINCQARSAALFVALAKRNLLNFVLASQDNFTSMLKGKLPFSPGQQMLF